MPNSPLIPKPGHKTINPQPKCIPYINKGKGKNGSIKKKKKEGKNVLAPATSQQPTSIPIPFPSAMQIRPIKAQ
jgi:hypothetical protein